MRLWDDAKALRRVTLWLYTIVVMTLCVTGFKWLWDSPYFPVQKIHFYGELQETNATDLAEVAQKNITGNFFKADMNVLKEALLKDQWIESVRVQRLWPDTINVFVEERQVAAKQDDKRLIDTKGVVFMAQTEKTLPLFKAPVYMLPKMVVFQDKMMPLLRKQNLNLQTLEVSERGAWTVVLNNGVVVKLGRRDLEPRLQRFLTHWQRDLAPLGGSLEYVDVRYHDGFAIRRDAALAVKLQKEAEAKAKANEASTVVNNAATIKNNESNIN